MVFTRQHVESLVWRQADVNVCLAQDAGVSFPWHVVSTCLEAALAFHPFDQRQTGAIGRARPSLGKTVPHQRTMPINIDTKLTPQKLVSKIERLFELSAGKILSIEKTWKPAQGTPVFTVKGRYTSRGWTEWTQGFQYGSALLQFDATGDERFLEIGRRGTVERMATHVSHIGVHDHGFNNVSTYGNLLRLMREGKIPHHEQEQSFYELALKVSGAVQAARWTRLADGTGFVHSFNGPHSLFVDTIRSCRALAVAHQLDHVLMGEQDARISLLQRLVEHALNTARYIVYYGEGRDAYDVRGRTAHEAVFNTASGVFRCPNSQQGYSPFSTWTRGLAWAICGFAEQLEFLHAHTRESASDYVPAGGKQECHRVLTNAATATADFYLANCCADGIPMWDTGAPNLHRLPATYLNKRSDPFNQWEPVDSSAAAIAAQGLIRLGNYLGATRHTPHATGYRQAGLTIARTLFSEPYLSTNPKHQGLILHSVYHRPNGWDCVAPGQKVPNGESSMWGDYHARELALLLLREARGEHYLTFFAASPPTGGRRPKIPASP
jgi:unsaturated chondroitin disaccharide hydrolase